MSKPIMTADSLETEVAEPVPMDIRSMFSALDSLEQHIPDITEQAERDLYEVLGKLERLLMKIRYPILQRPFTELTRQEHDNETRRSIPV